ncbi:DNA-binding transcriptional LysR family regulator [Bradyrhizobium daqingense]
MNREDASDLLAFLAVARERSFTRAAAKLGMTQSALSQIIRNLEGAARRAIAEPNDAERHAD